MLLLYFYQLPSTHNNIEVVSFTFKGYFQECLSYLMKWNDDKDQLSGRKKKRWIYYYIFVIIVFLRDVGDFISPSKAKSPVPDLFPDKVS